MNEYKDIYEDFYEILKECFNNYYIVILSGIYILSRNDIEKMCRDLNVDYQFVRKVINDKVHINNIIERFYFYKKKYKKIDFYKFLYTIVNINNIDIIKDELFKNKTQFNLTDDFINDLYYSLNNFLRKKENPSRKFIKEYE